MDAHFTETLEDFMESALVMWVCLFENMVDGERTDSSPHHYMEVTTNSQNALKIYKRLTNGIFLNEVMRIIDPNPKVEQIYRNVNEDQIQRVQNFSVLNRHLRSYYQENLQQLILMPLPNIAILGRDPLTEGAVEELRRLLVLLLGCAVQCERKETFIQHIQSLDIETQTAIAVCIQEVTQDPRAVLPLQYAELCGLQMEEIQSLFSVMAKQIQGMLSQRDTHLERIAELCQECESSQSHSAPPAGFGDGPPEGLAVQLADCKAKLRRLKQELEDKGDQLLDYKLEVQTLERELKKLQQENRTLQGEARVSRALRDELDCLRDRAAKAEQLQTELQSCTHRLRSLDLCRTQLKEQQQYCTTLQENKALLDEQLADARARCSALRELERDNFLLRQKLMDLEGERDTERQRVDELLEMNMSLQSELKHSPVVTSHFHQSEMWKMESEDEDQTPEPDLKPLSVEVDEASSLRLLGAENENAELRRRLELLQAEREDSAGDMREELDRLRCLEEEHQSTLREFQNMKNENVSLKKSLEQLKTKQELINTEEKTKSPTGERTATPRGEGEGKDTRKEEKLRADEERKEDEIIRVTREDGEGEEVLYQKEKKDEEGVMKVKTKDRGEAEGEKEIEKESDLTTQKEMREEEGTRKEHEVLKPERKDEDKKEVDHIPSIDTSHLTAQLQEAQEETDRQTAISQDLRSKLGEQSKKAWEAEQRLVVLEAQTQRLRKSAEMLIDARKQIEALQSESLQVEEELTRLRSQVEVHKMEATVIAQLEGERTAMEKEREALKASVETLRAAVRKSDQLELTNQTLKAELERLGRGLDSARRREEELEAELRESSLEAESAARGRDQALLEVARLEQEKEALQGQLDSQRREQRQREREVARLRQQLESTASALEHSNQRACSLEAEHRRACQELSHLKELSSKLQDLEREIQSLTVLNTEGKQQISSLTQELANEKIRSQELSNQADELTQKLEKSESNQKLSLSFQMQELANEKIRSRELFKQADELTQKLEQSDSNLKLAIASAQKQSEQSAVEPKPSARVTEASEPDAQTLPHAVAQHVSAQSRQPSVDVPEVGPQISREAELAGGRLSRDHSPCSTELNERLIDVERENASLQKEREALQAQLSQCQSSCAGLKEQLDTLQRHSISLQENCAKLQALNTKLQVEQATLSTQHASVVARCSENEARCTALEAESKVWVKERAEATLRMEALRRDHDRLTALQERQEVELEELLAKHRQLKSSSRTQEAQFKELEARYQELLERKTQLERGEEAIQAERERMGRSAQEQMGREKELERLRADNDRFQAQQREWVQVQSELLAQGSVLRSELNSAQLERTRLEGELSTLKEQNQNLDLNYNRLHSQYQLLTQLKGNMEEENRHLVEQNLSLSQENRALMERNLEKREEHHTQQRENLDKLNELRREKQKLVEKIMDQYRVLEPTMPTPTKAKKSNWIADRMMKLIKPRAGREGRAQFIAAGSIENLAETGDIIHHSPPLQASPDPRSAPGSPNPLRRIKSSESEEPSKPGQRSGRRKLGSRHGWALGRGGRGGSISQSFSPGDQRGHPRDRWRNSEAVWEAESSPSPSRDSLSEEGKAESEDSLSRDLTPDRQNLSSGAEDALSNNEKSLD